MRKAKGLSSLQSSSEEGAAKSGGVELCCCSSLTDTDEALLMEVNWDCKLTNWPGAMVLLRAEPGESVLLARGGVMEDNDPWFEVIGVMGGNADDDFLDDEFPGSETSLGLAALVVVEERAAVANGLCALKEIRLGSISDFECGSGIRGPDLGRFGSDTGETMGGLPRSLIGSSSSDFSSNVATCLPYHFTKASKRSVSIPILLSVMLNQSNTLVKPEI